MKILLLPGAHYSPPARYRIIQFVEPFIEAGYKIKMRIPTPDRLLNTKKSDNKFWHKINPRVAQFVRLISILWCLRDIWKWETVITNRDIVPDLKILLPERIIKFFKVKLIVDIDDAVYLGNRKNKMDQVIKMADIVVCGNETLQKYVSQINSNTYIIPTVVDTEKFKPNPNKIGNDKTVIGWMGSSGPAKYHLPLVYPALIEISKNFTNCEFLFVSDIKPEIPKELDNVKFVKWSEENEVQLLQQMNIGLMPLPDNDFERGKCGFKAIQYMSVGIPAIVSPVGVNSKIVDKKVGFLCKYTQDWFNSISVLIKDIELRKNMGLNARIKIVEKYSSVFALDSWLSILKTL